MMVKGKKTTQTKAIQLIDYRKKKLLAVGWREWLALPELGIGALKAKIDTGARTSALHAFAINPFREAGKHRIHFQVHPLQRSNNKTIVCVADIEDVRWVTDSGGHKERRYVIKTLISIGGLSWPIEVTLTNRDTMNFRMLLGRTAMRNRIMVNPAASYLIGNSR
jgi:hypothetical protein